MRTLLCSLILFCGWMLNEAPKAIAQNSFAPVGAEWYHNMGFGVFHSVVTGDTVLNGIACRHIAVRPMVKNPERAPSSISSYDFYVYDNTDTVFIYNNLFGKFTPLYVFNVQAGDTLHLPVLPLYDCFYYENLEQTDSQFVIVIDSVVMQTWDNVPLKTVYSHPVERVVNNIQFPYIAYATIGNEQKGVYVASLGSVKTGFLPICLQCNGLLDDRCQPIGQFRCYHDDNGVAIALVDSCDDNIGTGIHETNLLSGLAFYPNPVHQLLHVSFEQLQSPIAALEIFDVLGRKIFVREISRHNGSQSLQVDVSGWASGIYLLKLKTIKGTVAAGKFVKE